MKIIHNNISQNIERVIVEPKKIELKVEVSPIVESTKLTKPIRIYYVHVPKTGGTSIYRTLNTDDNIIMTDRRWHRPFKNTNDFKLLSVRDPYSRLLSAYHYVKMSLKRSNKNDRMEVSKYKDFKEFVSNLKPHSVIIKKQHFLPQTHWSGDDINKYDHVIRMESIDDDWQELQSKLGIKLNKLVEKNVSGSKLNKLDEVYNSEMIKIVNSIYAKDFEVLHYKVL